MAATDILRISQVRVRIDQKIISDSGFGTILPAQASSGLIVNFNKVFLDVRSLVVTAALRLNGGVPVPLQGIYDFLDVPNPTHFTAYLINTSTGQFDYGDFSWSCEGIGG